MIRQRPLDKLHYDLLSYFLPLLPRPQKEPLYYANEADGVPFFARIGAVTPFQDALLTLVLWPGDEEAVVKQHVCWKGPCDFIIPAYEVGVMRISKTLRSGLEALFYKARQTADLLPSQEASK